MLRAVVVLLALSISAACGQGLTTNSLITVTPLGSGVPGALRAAVNNPNGFLTYGNGALSVPVTVYTTIAATVAGALTPSGPWSVQAQGCYTAGDGCFLTWDWSSTSYCPGGTSGSPVVADGYICILPIVQSSSTAGRYLQRVGARLDVRSVGILPGGMDIAPQFSYLMAANAASGAIDFPPGVCYQSSQFTVDTSGSINCGADAFGVGVISEFIVAAGWDGIVEENSSTAPNGRDGGASIKGCIFQSLGRGSGTTTASGASVTGVSMPSFSGIGPTVWGAGDGIIAIPSYQPSNSAPSTPNGAYITGVSGSTLTIASGFYPTASAASTLIQLPAAMAYSVTTTSGSSTITVVSGPRLIEPGDHIWADFAPYGTIVVSATQSFPQTVVIETIFYGTYQNATVSHAGGSGQMWNIPVGYEARISGHVEDSLFLGFGIGISTACGLGTPSSNCTSFYYAHNSLNGNLVGTLTWGNNTTGVFISNNYAQNSVADVVEASQLGSVHVGETYNSTESGSTAPNYDAIGNCGSDNFSVFSGYYITTSPASQYYCMSSSGLGAALSATPSTAVMFLNGRGGTKQGAISWQRTAITGLSIIKTGNASALNQDITGTTTLNGGGTATYSMTGTYAASPICIVQDVTTPSGFSYTQGVSSPWTLTFSGTASDIVNWICVGRD